MFGIVKVVSTNTCASGCAVCVCKMHVPITHSVKVGPVSSHTACVSKRKGRNGGVCVCCVEINVSSRSAF